MKYILITTISTDFLNSDNAIKSTIRSMLDANFNNDNEELDELEYYILEKLANKEIDVLV